MVSIKLKYVVEDLDRHGNVRRYFRRKGQPKIRLHGLPGSKEFNAAYQTALSGNYTSTPKLEGPRRGNSGSFKWLCESYFSSSDFKQLDPRTQKVRRNTLDSLCKTYGSAPIKELNRKHVAKLLHAKLDRPEAANTLLKALRQVLAFGVKNDVLDKNVASDVAYLKSNSNGFEPWTEEEICQFEKTHPLGSKARLALALLLYTGQRRSDIVKLGRQHVRDGAITLTQHKNRKRKPVTLTIPIIEELRSVLDQSPCGDLTFLVNDFGRPFTADGFGNKFRDWCRRAGLQNKSAHGLRKAAGARMAEAGCSDREIMAVLGHRTAKEVTRYTASAEQKRLAVSAMKKVSGD